MTTPDFYRNRIVLAGKNGQLIAAGPTHSAEALSALERELEQHGYEVRGILRLTSPAQLRAMPEGDSR